MVDIKGQFLNIKIVKKGEKVAVPAETFGCMMQDAEEDGIMFEYGDKKVFVPRSFLKESIEMLKTLKGKK